MKRLLALGCALAAGCTDVGQLQAHFCDGNPAAFCQDGGPARDAGGGSDGGATDSGSADSGADAGSLDAGRTLLVTVQPYSSQDVVLGPNGASCDGGTCAFQVDFTVAHLHAYTGPFSGVSGWSLAGCPLDTTCDVPVSASTVRVTFAAANRAFVSSLPFQPASTLSRTAASAFCRSLALDAGLIPPASSTGFAAYLHTTSSLPGPADRYVSANGIYRGWVRVDGAPVLDTFVTDGGYSATVNRFYYPLDRAEDGGTLWKAQPNATAWVGGYSMGVLQTCSDWTFGGVNANGEQVPLANIGGSVNFWSGIGYGTPSCGPYPLYCFEQATAVAIELPPPPPHRVFVSQPFALDGGGLSQLYDQCSRDAASAGLTGTFRPLAADTHQSALDRASLIAGPWYRLDGAQLVANSSDLALGAPLKAPIIDDAWGRPVSAVTTWTGATSLTNITQYAYDCTDYTDDAGTSTAVVGDPNQTLIGDSNNLGFFYVGNIPICGASNAVYCVEQ